MSGKVTPSAALMIRMQRAAGARVPGEATPVPGGEAAYIVAVGSTAKMPISLPSVSSQMAK